MALQSGQFRLTGKLGDLIFYQRKGVHCVRRRPESVTQTNNTREAALRFGMASRTGKLIRQAFAPEVGSRHDGEWVNRLNKLLLASGITGIKGYRFIQKTDIGRFLQTPVSPKNNILRVPGFFKPRDRKITHMQIKFIAVRIDFNSGQVINTVSHAYMHDVKKDFKPIEFDTTVKGKGTLLIALQVHPYQDGYPLRDQHFMATDIIAVEPAPVAVSKKSGKLSNNNSGLKKNRK